MNNFFVLHDMQLRFESLESDSTGAIFDAKISSIASWEHVQPENTIHCNGYFDNEHL